MYHVEKHIIKKGHRLYKEIDRLAFASKNLYNSVNYVIRQNYFNYVKHSGVTEIIAVEANFNFDPAIVYDRIINSGQCTDLKYLSNVYVDKLLTRKNQVDYRQLPAKVAKQVLIQVHEAWKGYFNTLKDFKKNPTKYKGMPRIPKYKEKLKGRNELTYELGAISKTDLKQGFIKLSQTNIRIPFINKGNTLKEVRIIKNNLAYTIEIVYDLQINIPLKTNNRIIAIDLGINNLGTITHNTGERPIIINGKHLKSINQHFNKVQAKNKATLPEKVLTSNKIKRLWDKRNRKINHEFHQVSNYLVKYCQTHDLSTVVFGYNPGWKNAVNLGSKTNQNFCSLPYLKLIKQVEYKLLKIGVTVMTLNEAYTSKCSALDNEPIGHHINYMGQRIKRGLFKTRDGFEINADVNGSYNILRKVVPDFKVRNRGLAVNPIKVYL